MLIEKVMSNLKPVPKMSVSDWSDKFRMLPSSSAEGGRWKTSRVPYAKDIMDAFTQPKIHRVVAMLASQLSKTESMLNIIGRFAHLDPCNIMMIQPTIEMAEDISKDRLTRMVEDTKVLQEIFSRDKSQTILSKQFKGGRLVLAGANSPAGLASRPIRILLCDEVDRFPESAGLEGDPVNLAAKRTSSYWNYCIGLFSTPTIKNHSRIEQEFLLGTQEYWSYKCPNCGEFFQLDYRQFVTVEGEIKFRCKDCGYEFTEREIKSTEQKYIVKNPDALEKGIRSFWVNAFSSPWLSWQQIFQEWTEARGKPALEKVVMNTRFAESYEVAKDSSLADESAYLKSRIEYGAELPEGVLILTAAVDVQANRLEFEICGWGAGEVRYGILRDIIQGNPAQYSTWQDLDAVLDRQYYFADGRSLKVARTFIDSGYSARQVYTYCAENLHKGRYAIKGKGAPGLPLIYQYTYPKGYGITLTILGVNDGKQEIFSRLKILIKNEELRIKNYELKIKTENAMVYPADDEYFTRRGYDEIYFKQLFSERQVLKRTSGVAYLAYEPLCKGIRNESLDLAVYNLACVKSLNLDWTRLEVEVAEGERPVTRQKKITSRTIEVN